MNIHAHIRFAVLVASAVAVPVAAQVSTIPQRTVTIHTDEVIPASAPQSLAERLSQVDAAVRCRIERSDVRVIQKEVPVGVDPIYGSEPETDHTVTVLELFKGNIRLPVLGFTTTIGQPIGTAVVNGTNIVRDGEKFRPFLAGEEYVLFLTWNAARAQFEVQKPADAFLLTGGVVTTSQSWPYSRGQSGAMVPEFLGRIRSASTVARP
jgi:hypothetical protein